MKKMSLLTMAIAMVTLAGSAMAYPSLMGPTGGANMPLADTVGAGKFQVAVDYVAAKDFPFKDAIPMRVLYGVADSVELGASFVKQDTEAPGISLDSWSINGKWVTPLELGDAKLAIGGIYEKTSDINLTMTQFYLVITKPLTTDDKAPVKVRGSVGANWTKASFDFGPLGSVDANKIRPFLDLDLAFGEGYNLTAEYQFKNKWFDIKPLSSLVLRKSINSNWAFQLGVSNAMLGGFAAGPRYYILGGLNYTFGGK